VNLVPTELNQQLTAAVEHAIAAERFYIAGKAVFWKLIGLGLICCGIGGAVGLSLYGYSYVSRNSVNMNSLSAIFAKALTDAQLNAHAEGSVTIEPHEIQLEKDQTISIDHSSRLLFDRDAKILVDGDVKVQLASPVLPTNVVPRQTLGHPLITNFTVFKHVPFKTGTVMTGWEFLTSKQKSPTSQYCYYTEESSNDFDSSLPGLSVVVYLGLDQKLDVPKTIPKDFDVTAAFARCVWFRS